MRKLFCPGCAALCLHCFALTLRTPAGPIIVVASISGLSLCVLNGSECSCDGSLVLLCDGDVFSRYFDDDKKQGHYLPCFITILLSSSSICCSWPTEPFYPVVSKSAAAGRHCLYKDTPALISPLPFPLCAL